MTRSASSLVLGYHGCSERLGRKALSDGLPLEPSDKDYDWLGPGIYFWENDPVRAREWAESKAARGAYGDPFVIGALIDLSNCLDLLTRENIELLAFAYESLRVINKTAGVDMPENKDSRAVNRGDKLLRYRDCAVIRHLHEIVEDEEANPPGSQTYIEPFDTVRGLFVEGKRAYPGGGFFSKTHTQIAVRNERCIKGIFLPR